MFSPRSNSDALEWYGELASAAKDALFMTFAFGMSDVFREVYSRTDDVLRVGLMEKEWNGANKDAQIAAIRKIQALPNVVIAIGNKIPLTGFDQWLAEMDKIDPKAHVHVGAPEVHAGRPAVRPSGCRHRISQFQRRKHDDQRREHARDQRQHPRCRHLLGRVHAALFALRVP